MATWKTKRERLNLVLTDQGAEFVNTSKRRSRFPLQTAAILHQLLQTGIELEAKQK